MDLSSPFLSSSSSSSCPCNTNHGNLLSNRLTINATDGRNPIREITLPSFITSCDTNMVVGLGRSSFSLSSQIYSKVNLKKQFAICLPDTNYSPGVVFFGREPFEIMPPTQFDVSTIVSYTPFMKNSKTQSYLLTLNGIAINGLQIIIPFQHGRTALLSMTKPYTLLRSDIYHLFIDAFDNKATAELPWLPLVRPFDLCFIASSLGFSRFGYVVPQIGLMIDGNKNWTIFGINSMKQVGEEMVCLGFVDGSLNKHAVEIGGLQMENSFLLFDEEKSRLGFSSNLISMRLTCGGFNFTTV